MRAAWSRVLLHSPPELLRSGMSAFKANWREQQHNRRLLRAAMADWRVQAARDRAVGIMRRRIKEVGHHGSMFLPTCDALTAL